MTRTCRFAYLAGLVLAVAGILGTQARGPVQPPPTSTLTIPVRGSRQKPPVPFSHRLHQEQRVPCEHCHHEYQGRRNVWRQGQPVQKCQSCHGLAYQARRPDIKNALHRQCKGCHLKLRQQGRLAGPVECQYCHRRT